MGKPAKALHHHGKAGEALKKGDLKAAAHHMGHALAACRNPEMHDDESGMDYGADDEAPEQSPAPSLRDRLKGFGRLMPACQQCMPWNLPCVLSARLSADGVQVPMTYQDAIWYHIHVVQHQAGHWAGEIESLAILLAKTQESVL